MSNFKFKVGTKPSEMSNEIFRAILERAGQPETPCERFKGGDCMNDRPCQKEISGLIPLDFSRLNHSEGYTAENTILECSCENRKRQELNIDPFDGPSPFDDEFDYSLLRNSQYFAIDDVDAYSVLWGEKRDIATQFWILDFLATGVGKTLFMVAKLHRIAQKARTQGIKKRPMRVLWLAPEISLASSLMKEARDEPVNYGMRKTPIRVYDAGGSFSLHRAAPEPGIVFACPHTFFKRKDEKLNDDQIKGILSYYDTIIADEGDWADEQLGRLVKLAPHALKFALTATPIDCKGELLSNFALGSVITYEMAMEFDKCLKFFNKPDDHTKSINIINIDPGEVGIGQGQEEKKYKGASNERNSNSEHGAAIIQAIKNCDALETRMRIESPSLWYSPHLIIRMNGISEAKYIFEEIKHLLLTMRNELRNTGWDVCMVYGGIKEYPGQPNNSLPEFERTLANPKKHPWFLAKENNGRAVKDSKRILIVCQMGIRGINNWPCYAAIDLTTRTSLVELTQFAVTGRIGRLPPQYKEWANADSPNSKFITPIIYIASDRDGKKQKAYLDAIKFQFNAREIFNNSGIRTLQNLIDGAEPPANIDPTTNDANIFSKEDKWKVHVAVNQMCEEQDCSPDELTDEEIEEIVDKLPPPVIGNRRQYAKQYTKQFAFDENKIRSNLINKIPESYERVVIWATPKEIHEYTDEELAKYSMEQEDYSFSDALDDIKKLPPRQRNILAKYKQKDDEYTFKMFGRTENFFRAKNEDGEYETGVVNKFIKDWFPELVKRQIFNRMPDYKDQASSISKAICEVFGLDDKSNQGKFGTAPYRYKLANSRVETKVYNIALVYLAEKGYINISRLAGKVHETIE